MLLFDGRWGTATPATGVGWAPAGHEPAVFRVHVSRTFTWYDADDEWEDKMSLTLMIEFLGEVGTVGEAQVTGYGGPPREGIGDAHDTEIRDWAGQVDTCAVAVESCAPFAAFDALSPTQFLVCFDSAY